MLKSRVKPLLGIALTVFFLGIVLVNLKFEEVGIAFGKANYLYLFPAITITMLAYFVRAWRWQIILRPTKKVAFKDSYAVMMIGFMANNLLPARVGEFVRAYTLGAQQGISKSLSLATIVLERVCDGLTLVALMGLSLLAFPSPQPSGRVQFIEIFSTGVFGGAIVFLFFLMWQEKLALRLISFAMRPLPARLEHRALALLASFVMGLHALKQGKTVVVMALTSLLVWGMEGSSYYMMLYAFNLQNSLNPVQLVGAGLLLLVFVNLGTMVPSAPGFFGVYQLAATIALGAYAVSNETAFSLALLTNSFQYLTVTAIGLVFFSRRHMSFAALRASKKAGDAEQQQEAERAASDLGLEVAETPEQKARYAAADS